MHCRGARLERLVRSRHRDTALAAGLDPVGPRIDERHILVGARQERPQGGSAGSSADDDDLRAVPFAFVGAAGDCGTGYPAGSNIVTAAWLRGMGLPDNGGPNSNPVDPRDNPNKTDPHLGLLLSKNGPTADCSASGAEIKGVRGMRVTTPFILGFDYRNGGHSGGGGRRV